MEDTNRKLFGERLAQTAEAFGGVVPLSREVGVSDRTIRKWLDGDSDPDREYVVKIAHAAGVNIAWLAAGEGVMKGGSHFFEGKQALAQGLDYVMIPAFNIIASAGEGVIPWNEAQVGDFPFRLDFLKGELRARIGNLSMIPVEGDSMHPTLSSGDQIMVDRSDTEIRGGDGIYVIRLGDALMVKRIQRMPGGIIEIASDNPSYKLFTVEAGDYPDDFSVIGRVVWYGKWA